MEENRGGFAVDVRASEFVAEKFSEEELMDLHKAASGAFRAAYLTLPKEARKYYNELKEPALVHVLFHVKEDAYKVNLHPVAGMAILPTQVDAKMEPILMVDLEELGWFDEELREDPMAYAAKVAADFSFMLVGEFLEMHRLSQEGKPLRYLNEWHKLYKEVHYLKETLKLINKGNYLQPDLRDYWEQQFNRYNDRKTAVEEMMEIAEKDDCARHFDSIVNRGLN
jgi:hypothetical protein